MLLYNVFTLCLTYSCLWLLYKQLRDEHRIGNIAISGLLKFVYIKPPKVTLSARNKHKGVSVRV